PTTYFDFFTGDGHHRDLHSFPTRRSSDLGATEEYVFDNFTFFSRRIAEGSRLRLIVSSINSTGTEKNYNSGGVVAAETGKDAKTDRKSTRLNSSHVAISYAVFCLKKKPQN